MVGLIQRLRVDAGRKEAKEAKEAKERMHGEWQLASNDPDQVVIMSLCARASC